MSYDCQIILGFEGNQFNVSGVLGLSESKYVNLLSSIFFLQNSDHNSASDQPPRLYERGRPSYIIPRQQLEILVDLNFSNREIGDLLHVSAAVIKRRLRYEH